MAVSVFEVDFGCGNCGATWTDDFPKRTNIGVLAYGVVVAFSIDCSDFGHRNCDCHGEISCVVCDLKKHVKIKERRPINGDT